MVFGRKPKESTEWLSQCRVLRRVLQCGTGPRGEVVHRDRAAGRIRRDGPGRSRHVLLRDRRRRRRASTCGVELVNASGAGDVFGEMALVDHQPRTATVVADTDLKLLRFGTRDFHRLMDEMPKANERIMGMLRARLERFLSRLSRRRSVRPSVPTVVPTPTRSSSTRRGPCGRASEVTPQTRSPDGVRQAAWARDRRTVPLVHHGPRLDRRPDPRTTSSTETRPNRVDLVLGLLVAEPAAAAGRSSRRRTRASRRCRRSPSPGPGSRDRSRSTSTIAASAWPTGLFQGPPAKPSPP